MAETTETVLLELDFKAEKVAADLSEAINRLEAIKKSQKDYNALLAENGELTKEQAKDVAEINAQYKEQTTKVKALTATLNSLTQAGRDHSGSINDERRALNDMLKVYDQMDASMRESEGGKEFLAQIQAQHEKVLELEKATGRAQRNVGNYQSAVTGLVPGMGKLDGVLKNLGTSFTDVASNSTKAGKTIVTSLKGIGKAFITPPIAIITVIVGAIVAVFSKLKEAFNKSDDAGTALASGLAVLKPIGTAIGKVFDSLANALGKMVEGIGNFISGVMKAGAALGLWSEETGNAAAEAQKLVHAQDDLEEAERQYTLNSAERNKEVAKLRDEAIKAGDPEERKKKLEKALELEKANLEDEKKLAAEKVRILEATAKQENDTSDATKNKITEARAAMYDAEREYYTGTRRLQREYQSTLAEIENEEKKRVKEQRKRWEEQKKKREELAKEEKKIAVQLQEALIATVEDEGKREIMTLTLSYDKEIDALKEQLRDKSKLTKQAQEDLQKLILLKTEERERAVSARAKELADEEEAQRLEREQMNAEQILRLKLELAEENSQTELEARLALIDYELERELASTELAEETKALLAKKYQEEKTKATEAYYSFLQEKRDKDIADEKKAAEERKQANYDSFVNTANAASSAFGAMSDLLASYGEESAEAAKASKAFGLTSILINEALIIADTAKAIASAVAAATEAGGFTGPAAPVTIPTFIATTVAAVLAGVAGTISSIMQAKQLLSEADSATAGAYANGGIVGGTSYTGDKLVGRLNSREMVLTQAQQAQLFNIANGQGGAGFAMESVAAAMAAAVANMPAPVMAYSEFKSFEGRTAKIKELAKI